MTLSTSPLVWYGGKALLASQIVSLLPAHTSYVEAFGGAASVLLSKQRCKLEVYNDVDFGVVSFFRVLRDRPDELVRALELTPYSRAEFEHCLETWADVDDDLERARRFFTRSRQGFSGATGSSGWSYDVSGAPGGGTAASRVTSAVDDLMRHARRLRGVQIECRDWREMLELYDEPGACFYLDPPYHPDTRGGHAGNGYAHELTADDHADLVELAASLKGSVLISGYPHPSYDRPLERAGFERITTTVQSTASRAQSGRGPRVEVLWRRCAHGGRATLFG